VYISSFIFNDEKNGVDAALRHVNLVVDE
jgi:hypothetical protein